MHQSSYPQPPTSHLILRLRAPFSSEAPEARHTLAQPVRAGYMVYNNS
jgi:hypothetical protein